jgi:hypothetical protein
MPAWNEQPYHCSLQNLGFPRGIFWTTPFLLLNNDLDGTGFTYLLITMVWLRQQGFAVSQLGIWNSLA